MAKTSHIPRSNPFKPAPQPLPPETPPPAPREPQPRYVFRIGWLLVPLCILGMSYLLRHIQPVLRWETVMDLLHVHDRQRYTQLAILCLIGILVVAAVRILGKKAD